MESLNLELEYLMLFDPNKIPENKKADEVEFMDAKNLLFYPALVDINKKRNLVGTVEGIISFFNRFQSIKENGQIDGVQLFVLQNRFFVCQWVENSIHLALVFKHNILKEVEEKHQMSVMDFFPLKIFQQQMNNFLSLFFIFFGNFTKNFENEEKKIKFTERFFLFIESYFHLNILKEEQDQITSFGFINLYNNVIRRQKYPSFVLTKFISLRIIFQHKYQNFYDLAVYNKNSMVYSELDNPTLAVLNRLVSESDFGKERKTPFSKFFIEFFNIESTNISKSFSVISDKQEAFQLFHNKFNIQEDLYLTILVRNETVVFCLWKSSQFDSLLHSECLTKIKDIEISNSVNEKDIIKNTLHITYYNILTNSFTLSEHLYSLNLMNKLFLYKFIYEFFLIQNSRFSIYNFQIISNAQSILFNLLNDRIVLLFTNNKSKIDIFDEFEIMKKNLKLI